MKKYLPIVIIVAVVAIGAGFALSGNSKKTDNSAANNTSASPSPSQNSASNESNKPTANPVAAATNAVSITNFSFSPAKITVKMGTKVTWTNNDSVAHTVTADSGTGPKSDNISPGGTFTYTFDSAGTFAYHCSIHPDMTGSVTVTP